MLRGVSRRQYRIDLYNGHGEVIEGAEYMHVSEATPTRGLPIDLPQGTWFVHEVVATWSEDKSSQLLGSDPHYGGTLICRPDPPDSDSQPFYSGDIAGILAQAAFCGLARARTSAAYPRGG
jgi:hypothetical protein